MRSQDSVLRIEPRCGGAFFVQARDVIARTHVRLPGACGAKRSTQIQNRLTFNGLEFLVD